MNGAHLIVSDEEYLPLPKQLQPTPVGRWPDFTPYTGTSGDPTLQLTPDKGCRPLQETARSRNAVRNTAPQNSRTSTETHTCRALQNGSTHVRGTDFSPFVGDPSLELTPDKHSQPSREVAQDEQQSRNGTTSKSRRSKDQTMDYGNPVKGSKTLPQHLPSGDAAGTRHSSTNEDLGTDVTSRSHNPSKQKSSESGRVKKKKPETVAWVEKHGDVRSVYNPGKPLQDAVRVETVTSAHQKGRGHERNTRRSLESRGDFEVGAPPKGKEEQGRGAKEKERTQLKPILHKKGEGRGRAKSSSKKHVTLVVDSSPGLGRPQINSTSVLSARLRELEDESFDAEGAVTKTLQESEKARTTLEERAAGSTNVPGKVSKYQGLVSVDIPSQAVLDQALEERLRKLRLFAPDDGRQRKDPLPCPDVLDVFTPDMIVEYPKLDVSHLAIPPPRLEQVPSDEVFHLYRRISGWEK